MKYFFIVFFALIFFSSCDNSAITEDVSLYESLTEHQKVIYDMIMNNSDLKHSDEGKFILQNITSLKPYSGEKNFPACGDGEYVDWISHGECCYYYCVNEGENTIRFLAVIC